MSVSYWDLTSSTA